MNRVPPKCIQFALTIQEIFEKGLSIGHDTLQYIHSTISNSAILSIKAVFDDPHHCEKASLIELVFFPDEETQVHLEAIIEASAFDQNDLRSICGYLQSLQGKTTIHFPDQRRAWQISTPDSGANIFLERLKITKHLDPRLIAAIDLASGRRDSWIYKVRIRNSALEPRPRDIAFMESLFEKIDTNHEKFFDYFNFSLTCLEESKHETDLFYAFMKMKGRCLNTLRRSDQMEAARMNQPFEVLMAHGTRMPYIDRKAVLSKIAMIDDISLAIFGETLYEDALPATVFTYNKKL